MRTFKVCLLGATSVGKTSLVRRYVQGIFSDRYLTTVGVKIDKKLVDTPKGDVTLVVWDLAGEDEFAQLQTSYLRGASGYILVGDVTRPETLDAAAGLADKAHAVLGRVHQVVALNKIDLVETPPSGAVLPEALSSADRIISTSAKTGDGVEALFAGLATALVE